MRLAVNRSSVVHETIDGETIVIHMGSGTYYSLAGATATVWDLIDRQATVEGIVDALARRYDTAPADIDDAVRRLIGELGQEDLVILDAAAPGDSEASALDSLAASSPRERLPALRLEKYTDMQDLVRLDPVHEMGDAGWPHRKGTSI